MKSLSLLAPLALAAAPAAQTISADVAEIGQSIGGTQQLFLTAGAPFAGQTYFVAGTVSGTAPGFALGGFAIPLNPDFYFNFTVAHPNSPILASSFGAFDASGWAQATFALPAGFDAALIGLTASHAYVVLDPLTFALVGASNAASCALTAGPMPPSLVINEVDYDQPGSTDDYEFVELLNVSTQVVDLSNYAVELLDGLSGGMVYGTYSLATAGTLAPGEYLVLANHQLFPDPAAKVIFWGTSDLLDNGPFNAVRIVNTATLAVIDTLGYAGTLAGYSEGTSDTLYDYPDLPQAALARCPNGADSDDNDADFGFYKVITPGSDNFCM
jgi:hypothetical protein